MAPHLDQSAWVSEIWQRFLATAASQAGIGRRIYDQVQREPIRQCVLSRITSESSALSHASQGWQSGFSRGAALARADIGGASFDISSLSPPCKDNWSGGARSCNLVEPFWAAHQYSRLAIQTRTQLRSASSAITHISRGSPFISAVVSAREPCDAYMVSPSSASAARATNPTSVALNLSRRLFSSSSHHRDPPSTY